MRPWYLFLLVSGFVLVWIPELIAESYYALGYGNGGSVETNSFTLELGVHGLESENDTFQIALGFPVIFHRGDNIPENTKAESCSNAECKDIDSEYDGTEYGYFVKAGVDPFDLNLYLSIFTGKTITTLVKLAQSEATGEVYEQSANKETNNISGMGLGFLPDIFDWEMKLNVQLDYDNRRGFTAYLGWRW